MKFVRNLILKGLRLLPKLYKENMQDKRGSRKYKITLLVFFAAVIMCLFPPIISMFIFKMTTPLIVLSGTEFVSVISLVFSAYFASNVYQKKIIPEITNSEQIDQK